MKFPRPLLPGFLHVVLISMMSSLPAQAQSGTEGLAMIPLTEPVATLVGLVGLYILLLRRGGES